MAQSKAEMSDEQLQQKLDFLCKHMFANVITLTLNVQADPMLYSQLYDADMAAVARFVGAATASTSAMDFLCNPTIGAWSDANGRRKNLMLGPGVNAVLNLLLAALPKSLPSAFLVRIFASTANSISGTTSTAAAIMDLCQVKKDEKERGKLMLGTQTKMMTSAGMAVILGPAIGAAALARTGNPASVYFLKAIWSALHYLWLSNNFEETLKDEKKKDFDGSFKNPFNFIELFTKTPMLREVTIFNFLQCFGEGKCVNDLNQMWMKGVLDWDVQTTARWTVGYGVMMVVNGMAMKKLIPGVILPRSFVSLSCLMGFLALSIKGSIHDGMAYTLGLMVNTPAINAMGGGAIKAIGSKKAAQAGLGNADYQSKFANLRAIVYVIGPQLYLRIFAAQIARKQNPGAAYLTAALLAFAIPELLHRRWSDKDLE